MDPTPDDNVTVTLRRADLARYDQALRNASGDAEDEATGEALDDLARALDAARRR